MLVFNKFQGSRGVRDGAGVQKDGDMGGGDTPVTPDPVLVARDVSIRFGGVKALTDVSFDVRPGELFSIIGPTGAYK